MDGLNEQGGPPDLMSALQDLDQKFPPGLRTDRPYALPDIQWSGPFYGKGGPQLIRNPITGAALPMQPGTTPDTYLQAINSLAQTKARAKANILRGWNTDQAASEAIAKAWGVTPTPGMSAAQQGQITKAQVGARAAAQTDKEQAQRMAMTQQQMDALQEERTASRKEREQRDLEKQRADELRRAQMQTLPETMDALNRMDPEEAFTKAPQYLSPIADVNGQLYNTVLNQIGIRAQQKREMVAQEQQRVAKEADARDKAQRADLNKNVFDHLDAARNVAPKVRDAKMTMEEKMRPGAEPRKEIDYQNAVAEKLGEIKVALANAARKIPGFAQEIDSNNPRSVFAEAAQGTHGINWLSMKSLDNALQDPDPKQATSVLDRLIDLIEGRIEQRIPASSGAISGG